MMKWVQPSCSMLTNASNPYRERKATSSSDNISTSCVIGNNHVDNDIDFNMVESIEEQKVCFNPLILFIKIVCLHNRFNLCYNFIHTYTLSIDDSNCIKLPENKNYFNKGKNGLTVKTSKEEVNSNFPFNQYDRKLMEYIDSVSSEMFSPWLPKLLMDVFILTQHYEGYDIIKHKSRLFT